MTTDTVCAIFSTTKAIAGTACLQLDDEDAPTRRPAGSLAWAGPANLYYSIDRRNGVGGFWATQIFPFSDPTSVGGYLDSETAVYRSLGLAAAA